MDETKSLLDWPPTYTVKHHPRARHVKMRVLPQSGLELTVPKRFNYKRIPEILESNKAWIIKRLSELEVALQHVSNQALPDVIELPAISQTIPVQYIKMESKRIRIMSRPQQGIALLGDVDNQALCKKSLSEWVKVQAEIHFAIWLDTLCKETGLSYNKLVIRSQRSRWGSCSAEKTISLNYKLMFMSYELVRHILIHELCHTRHLNHSVKFWQLVAKFDPAWKEHARQLRKSDQWMPGWAV